MQKPRRYSIPSEFAELCRSRGLRATPQRIALYRELAEAGDHPTAETLYRAVRRRQPHISLDTVNRTLRTFAEAGLAEVVEGPGGTRRFDCLREAHHHFHCLGCGTIYDFVSREMDDLALPPEIENNFDVSGKRIMLSGLCPRCRAAAEEKHGPGGPRGEGREILSTQKPKKENINGNNRRKHPGRFRG